MDFEWQTRAPGDVTSPFYKLAMEHESQNKKRESFPPAVLKQRFHLLTNEAWHLRPIQHL